MQQKFKRPHYGRGIYKTSIWSALPLHTPLKCWPLHPSCRIEGHCFTTQAEAPHQIFEFQSIMSIQMIQHKSTCAWNLLSARDLSVFFKKKRKEKKFTWLLFDLSINTSSECPIELWKKYYPVCLHTKQSKLL